MFKPLNTAVIVCDRCKTETDPLPFAAAEPVAIQSGWRFWKSGHACPTCSQQMPGEVSAR